MQTTRRFVVILLFVMMCAARPGACPVPPPLPLRTLADASELIVTARFDRIVAAEKNERYARVIVQLRVAQVVKGNLHAQSINVRLWPGQLEGLSSSTDVLAFLTAAPDGGGYGLADERERGLKLLPAKALDVYLARLNELFALETLPESETQRQQLLEWLLRCVEEPATRWEGAFDLTYGRVAVGGDGSGKVKPESRAFTSMLNDEQKQRLSQALYQSPRIESGELELLSLVEDWGDENLIPFLWSYLKAGKQDEPSITSELLRRVAEAVASAEAEELVDQFQTAVYGSDDEDHPQPPADPQKALDAFLKRIESYGAPRLVVIKTEER